jgi:hypothetical protein
MPTSTAIYITCLSHFHRPYSSLYRHLTSSTLCLSLMPYTISHVYAYLRCHVPSHAICILCLPILPSNIIMCLPLLPSTICYLPSSATTVPCRAHFYHPMVSPSLLLAIICFICYGSVSIIFHSLP